jgi:hypothetical protein
MSISIDQARLQDSKGKQKYAEKTGYQYPNEVQESIQALVEGHLSFEEEMRLSSLIPRAGINNGVTYTQEDIDAYVAAHPQNAARKSDRVRIAEILAANGSMVEEEVDQEEKISRIENRVHERHPQIPTIETHYCKVATSVYTDPIVDEKYEFRTVSPDTDKIIVIDSYLGSEGNFSYAITEGAEDTRPFYIENDKIEKLPGLSTRPFEETTQPTGGNVQDWLNYPDMVPQEVPQTSEIRISVALDSEVISSPTQKRNLLEKAYKKGVSKILKDKGKRHDSIYLFRVFQDTSYWDFPAQATELHLDPRPGAKVKALVKVKTRNIIPLDDNEPEWSWKNTYKTEQFRGQAESLKSKIKSLEENIKGHENQGGSVSTFNASYESNNIEIFTKALEKLATQDEEYSNTGKKLFADKGVLTLYWDKDSYLVRCTLTKKSGKVYDFKNKFNEFVATTTRRTGIFFNFMETITSNDMELPWKDFLETYAQFKEVTITPKSAKNPAPTVPSEAEGPKIKTLEEFREENNYYSSAERKEKVATERRSQTDFAGIPVLSPLVPFATRTADIVSKDAEDLYDHFINKVDITKMALDAVKCMIPDIPLESLKSIKNDYEILEKEFERLKKEFKEGELLDFLKPEDIPTDDISEAFFKTLRKSLEGMLAQLITSIIGSLLGVFFDSCGKKDKSQTGTNPPALDNLLSDLQDMMQDLFDAGFVDPDTFRNLMNDLSNLLSLKELCDLLRGHPDQETLDIVKNLLATSYCELGLDTDKEIIDFFIAVSGSMNLSICDELGSIIDSLPEDFVCPPDSSVREGLLKGKGMSQEEIQDQLERERARNRAAIEQLLGDSLADRKGPNLFCTKDEDGNITPGELPFMDAQFEYTFETTLSSLFRSTYDSFSEEGMRFAQNLFVEVEEKETRHYKISPPSVADVTNQDPRPEGTLEVKALVTKRRPVPHLVKFYNNPSFGASGAKSLEINIPTQLGNSTDRAMEMLTGGTGGDTAVLQDILSTIKSSQSNTTSKIIVTELDYCEIQEKTRKPEPILEPEEEKIDVYKTDGLQVNDCGDNTTPVVKAEELSRLRPPQRPTADIAFDIENAGDCESQNIIGSSVKIGDKEYIGQREVTSDIISFMEENIGSESPKNAETCIRAIYNKSLKSTAISDAVRELRRSRFNNSSQAVARQIREKIYKILMKRLEVSTYVSSPQIIGEGTSSPYERYPLEFINLGPTSTPECDPHLLKLSQLIEEVKDGMQEAMCLDMDGEDDGSKLSPLESAMMKACIKATFRHYIIETLTTGILTTTTFVGRSSQISDLKCSYIIDKMRDSLNQYSKSPKAEKCTSPDPFSGNMPTYLEDFLEQMESSYGEENDGNDSLMRKIIKEEYEIVSEGLLDALLIEDDSNPNPILFFSEGEIPTFEAIFVNGLSILLRVGGSASDLDNPFIYFREGGEDFFSLVLDKGTLAENLESAYGTYISPDGSHKCVIPLTEKFSSDSLTVNKALLMTFFSIEDCTSALSIHEMETVSRMDSTIASFGETRDNLFSLFYAITPEKDDWKKQNPALSSVGGSSGLTKLFDFNNNVFDTPCTNFSYNFGNNELCWGSPLKGMGGFFALSLRMARDAALLEFKKYVERNDPAVKLASRLSFLSKLACVNIPTSAIAAAINLYNPLLTPLTAMGAAYHALGLGVFLPSSTLNSNSDEGHKAREQIRGAGLKLPPYCGEDFDEIDAARREEDQGQPSIREEDQGQQDTSENEESEMSDAERRYYNNFVNLTDEQLANKAIELQRILGTLDTRMKQITDVRSNYNSFGQRQFDNGNKDPENLSRRQHESYFMLKGSYDIAFKKLNVINMLQDR